MPIGKKENSHLISITYQVLFICLTLSPSKGFTSPICHSRGPPQSHKLTENTTKVTQSLLSWLFIGKEENNHLKSFIYQALVISPTPSPYWGGRSPIHHPRGPPQSPKTTQNTTEITRFAIAVFFIGKEGYSPLKIIKC